MKLKHKILLGLIAFLTLAQLIAINKINPEINTLDDFLVQTEAPVHIQAIIKSTCYDCHSYETKYPWYTYVAPLSWWISYHIDEGREELNFSVWNTYPDKRKKHKLEECREMIEEGEMPLSSYTWIHSEARLSAEDKDKLVSWIKKLESKF